MSQMATLSRETKCKYCGKPIAFIKTTAGKSMPVDPDPVTFWPDYAKSKFVMMDGTVKSGMFVPEEERIEGPGKEIGYISHFCTCPYAEEARRKKNKSERTRER